MFTKMDTDKSGTITMDEFREAPFLWRGSAHLNMHSYNHSFDSSARRRVRVNTDLRCAGDEG